MNHFGPNDSEGADQGPDDGAAQEQENVPEDSGDSSNDSGDKDD